MKKTVLLFAFLCACIPALSGCGSSTEPTIVEPTVYTPGEEDQKRADYTSPYEDRKR